MPNPPPPSSAPKPLFSLSCPLSNFSRVQAPSLGLGSTEAWSFEVKVRQLLWQSALFAALALSALAIAATLHYTPWAWVQDGATGAGLGLLNLWAQQQQLRLLPNLGASNHTPGIETLPNTTPPNTPVAAGSSPQAAPPQAKGSPGLQVALLLLSLLRLGGVGYLLFWLAQGSLERLVIVLIGFLSYKVCIGAWALKGVWRTVVVKCRPGE